jgi:hypothetical protein
MAGVWVMCKGIDEGWEESGGQQKPAGAQQSSGVLVLHAYGRGGIGKGWEGCG